MSLPAYAFEPTYILPMVLFSLSLLGAWMAVSRSDRLKGYVSAFCILTILALGYFDLTWGSDGDAVLRILGTFSPCTQVNAYCPQTGGGYFYVIGGIQPSVFYLVGMLMGGGLVMLWQFYGWAKALAR